MDLISEREAARIFSAHGLSLSAAQHLLSTGIAGEPVRAAGVKLYDAMRVEAVASRPAVTKDEVRALFPLGAMVIRLPRGRVVSATAEWPDTAQLLAGPWPFSFAYTSAVAVHYWQGRGVPLLLTVSGFVLSGAVTTNGAPNGSAEHPEWQSFELEAPGSWLETLRGRSLAFGRGAPVELLGDLVSHR